eukprot:TRINITY_DN10683_c0_g1_i1.p1 TRINITY_DN10683_c0_g1~~TRINITY_DN10683_c0_g1_i1.p1  ORF type:complete len:370 (+),score=69.30 TRINITY_DN10683_c0_g1_i1:98-1207(+)
MVEFGETTAIASPSPQGDGQQAPRALPPAPRRSCLVPPARRPARAAALAAAVALIGAAAERLRIERVARQRITAAIRRRRGRVLCCADDCLSGLRVAVAAAMKRAARMRKRQLGRRSRSRAPSQPSRAVTVRPRRRAVIGGKDSDIVRDIDAADGPTGAHDAGNIFNWLADRVRIALGGEPCRPVDLRGSSWQDRRRHGVLDDGDATAGQLIRKGRRQPTPHVFPRPGRWMRVKADAVRPEGEWDGARPGDVGLVLRYEGDPVSACYLALPARTEAWRALITEVEPVAHGIARRIAAANAVAAAAAASGAAVAAAAAAAEGVDPAAPAAAIEPSRPPAAASAPEGHRARVRPRAEGGEPPAARRRVVDE